MQNKKMSVKEWRRRYQSKPGQSLTGRSARFFAIYLTMLLAKTRITPNQITLVGVVLYIIGSFLFTFDIYVLNLIAFFILYFETILDGCDGEVFRYRGYKFGYGATYVEPISHDIKYGFMFLPIAFGAYLHTGSVIPLIFGAMASITKVLFRLARTRYFLGVQEQLSIKGHVDTASNFREDAKKSLVKKIILRIYLNLGTSTGMLVPLFIASLFNRIDLFVYLFGTLYFVLWLGLMTRQIWRFGKVSQQVLDQHAYYVEAKKRFKNKKVIIFDLDGTLRDTMGIFADIASYLIAWKYNVSRKEAHKMYISTSGVPFFKQLDMLFPKNSSNKEVSDMFEQRKVFATDHLEMNSEEKEIIPLFQKRGCKVAIASNNFQENVANFAKQSGLDFNYTFGYKDAFEKKDHILLIINREKLHPDQVLFIGDSVSDLKKALALGIDFIAKLGTFSKQDFEKEFANVISIRNLEELNDIL